MGQFLTRYSVPPPPVMSVHLEEGYNESSQFATDDALKEKTMAKTLKITLKESINDMLPTCDDKGVFTNDDDTYRKHK